MERQLNFSLPDHMEPKVHKAAPGMRPNEVCIKMPCLSDICPSNSPNFQLFLVIHSIGIASHFQLYLDSVVGNLLPAAMPYLLRHYKTEESAESYWETMVSARTYGISIGCFLTIALSFKFGLKSQTVFGTFLCISGIASSALLLCWETALYPVLVGRFLNGVGQGMVQTVGCVMLVEVSPCRKRGTAVAALTIWACAGEVLGMLFSLDMFLGRPDFWIWGMLVPLILLVPALVVLVRAPDSPRYLFKSGFDEEGRKALSYYQSSADARISEEEILGEINFLDNDRDENSNSMKQDNATVCDMWKRFKDGLFVRPLFLAAIVQGFVHLDDWLWVSYSTPIFEKNGMSSSEAQRYSLMMSIPQTLVSIGLIRYFDKFTRKQLLIWPSCASAVFALMAAYCLAHKGTTLGSPIWLAYFAMLDLCTAAISGESAYAIVPELFLSQDKVLGTAIVGIFQNAFGGILSNYILTFINTVGTSSVLVPFAIFNFGYSLFNWFNLPETSNKSAQEVSAHFSKDLPFKKLFYVLRNSLPKPVQAFTFVINVFFLTVLIHFCFKVWQKPLSISSSNPSGLQGFEPEQYAEKSSYLRAWDSLRAALTHLRAEVVVYNKKVPNAPVVSEVGSTAFIHDGAAFVPKQKSLRGIVRRQFMDE